MPLIMEDAWIHRRIDKNQGSSVIIMGQSERSELVTKRVRVEENDNNQVLRREDLNSGDNSSSKRYREKPLKISNYLEVIQDDSEEQPHVVQLLQERSHSFFIDGSVAQTERQQSTTNKDGVGGNNQQSQANLSVGQRVRYPQECSSKDILMGKSSAGQESSDLT